MNKSRILILLLISLMITSVIMTTSCTATIEPINVTLVIVAGDDEILNVTMPISLKEPTVLALVSEAAVIYEIDITYNENGDSVKDIDNYLEKKDESGVSYFWEYLINDQLPENTTGGKAKDQEIKDGMTVTYRYATYDPSTTK